MFSFRVLNRVVANEVQIEGAFRRRGFDIVYPEALSFRDQVALYAHAEVLAGMAGSGLHNGLFMSPNTEVVELGDLRYGKPSPTQVICNGVSGVRSRFIPFKGWAIGVREECLFDIAALETELTSAFGPGVAPAPSLDGALRWVANQVEIAYRVLRSMVGGLIRQVVGRRR